MPNIRLIARLDVKAPHLIKGIHLEGVRKVGDPQTYAQRYYQAGIDEIIYIDAVASLYDRNTIVDLVRETAHNVFVPITVGGGIRSVEDATELLRAGADKIAINTAATKDPELITKIAERFGAQCVVLSIQAKRRPDGGWEALRDSGREHTYMDVIEWAVKGQKLGAGEILLVSVDQEGTCKGFDVELTKAVSHRVSIPVIASGGMGEAEDLMAVIEQGDCDAVAMAHVLHYEEIDLRDLRRSVLEAGIKVRKL